MKRQLALVLGMILMSGMIQPVANDRNQIMSPGEVIVKYRGESPKVNPLSSIKLQKEWTFESQMDMPYTLAYFTSKHNSTQDLIHYFEMQDGVEYVEANTRLHAMTLELPNDPYAGEQWYISNDKLDYERSSTVDIGVESLWEKTDSTLEENVVAVIDTGVDYTHSDLAAHMWENKTTLPGKHGYNFIEQTDDPMDLVGHGTHCAGIIAAIANNDLEIAGISRNTKIMALKYMDETGSGMVSQAIDAYAYILEAKKQGVNIVAISNSWGDKTNPKALEDIIETAGQNGILSVCAAGNLGIDLDVEKTFPAGYASPYTIVVGASTPDDKLASFSCYGKYTVDVVAPGTNMLSTYNKEGYLPGIGDTDQFLLTFEDEKTGFKGENIQIVDTRSFSGAHSLLWNLKATPAEEVYVEGDVNTQYTNILELEVPASKLGSYFGISFWDEGPKREEDTLPVCYVDAYQNNKWINIGRLNLENINFWNTNWFPFHEGVTQLRLICMDVPGGSKVYLDQVGVGTSIGKYTYLQGTSIAAPIVTAEVAMLTRIFPDETPSQIRARVIGGVDRTMEGLVASDGRINMKKAIQNPYPVINTLTQNENRQIVLAGEFFGEQAGKVSLNGNGLDIVSWSQSEIVLKYTGDFGGYGSFKITRSDGETSTQLLVMTNPLWNWTSHAPLPIAVKEAATVVDKGTIYVIGGNDKDDQTLQSVYRYRVDEDTWEEVANLPDIENLNSYSYGATATALNNQVLLMTFDNIHDQNDYYMYSIKDDSWEKLDMEVIPEPREYAALITYKDDIYMVGGIPKGDYLGQSELSKDIWKLNKEKTQWKKVASLSEGRYAPIVGVAGDQMIITGGCIGDGEYINSTEIFNGKNLITGAALPFAGIYSQNTVFGGGAKLYIMTDGISFDVPGLIYSPDTNTWKNSSYRLGYSRTAGIGSAASGDQLFAVGGEEDYRTVATLRSIEIEEAVHHKGYTTAFLIGVAVIVIVVIVILITIWAKKNKKPKKIYIK